MHSRFSPDGRSDYADYVAQVDEGRAIGIGFTEHYEFWPGSDACGFFRESDYWAEITSWRNRGYQFFAGVEVDWMPEYAPTIRAKLAEHQFDYAIGSVHNLPSASISGRDTSAFREDAVFDRVITEYSDAVTSSLTMVEFDVVGHPGVFLRHFAPAFFENKPWLGRLKDMEDHLAREIAQSGKLVEVNTSGYYTAREAPCAGPFFLERYRAHGGTRISVGSDAHQASQLRRGFGEAGQLLASLGFGQVWLPWDQDRPVPLADYLE